MGGAGGGGAEGICINLAYCVDMVYVVRCCGGVGSRHAGGWAGIASWSVLRWCMSEEWRPSSVMNGEASAL
jgi:hypothetical protein